MAALCPGVQYGLSSQQNFGENKDLIFVKLTDSALRAIEEYLKNQNKLSCQSPTIKFLGNENGELSFPSIHHEGNSTSFSFSMSSTADMEGPAGSFECIQQIGPPPRGSLECLGSIPYKIRIHANEDVYEVTRNRMTEAEDKYKNKCTREIKPNQTDIGRKVKVKQISRPSVQPLIRREQQQHQQQQQQQQQPSALRESSLSKPSYQSTVPPSKQVHSTSSNSSSNGLSNGLGSNLVSSSRPQLHNKPSVPDIARRPLKERLIHLLALKPFKKVELYDRMNKEGGLRERNGMSSVLKQISTMKDNCYHLNRAMWNDVHEDWPFYTESEKQLLKRRKPANLTPPGSSDGGSSGSGQSPTSTHPGSPPQITTSSKRPGFYDGADGIPTKRQRVSHFKRLPTTPSSNNQPSNQQQQQQQQQQQVNDQMYRSPIESNNSQRRPVTDSRDASNMNPRSRESPTNGYFNSSPITNGFGMLNNNLNNDNNNKRNLNNLSDEEETNANNKKRSSCDSHSLSIGVQKTFNSSRSSSPATKHYQQQQQQEKQEKQQQQQALPPMSLLDDGGGGGGGGRNTNATERNGYYNGRKEQQHINDDFSRSSKYNKVTSSTQSSNRIARVSPDSQTDILPTVDVDSIREEVSKPSKPIKPDSNNDFPDYLTQYVTIKTSDQRRRYKADFNANYAEYRDLHGVVEKVSRRFAQLEERLKREDESSPKYKDLMKQIVKEYNENKKDLGHQKAKQRFQYLHDKLSHIKRLVLEYDQSGPEGQY